MSSYLEKFLQPRLDDRNGRVINNTAAGNESAVFLLFSPELNFLALGELLESGHVDLKLDLNQIVKLSFETILNCFDRSLGVVGLFGLPDFKLESV